MDRLLDHYERLFIEGYSLLTHLPGRDSCRNRLHAVINFPVPILVLVNNDIALLYHR